MESDGDWIYENGCLDTSLFYKDKDKLYLIEKGYHKFALSIKRKISHFQKKITNTKNIKNRQKPIFKLMISHLYHQNQTQRQINKITQRP